MVRGGLRARLNLLRGRMIQINDWMRHRQPREGERERSQDGWWSSKDEPGDMQILDNSHHWRQGRKRNESKKI